MPTTSTGGNVVRVLHVNDCAFYARRVLQEAGQRRWPWSYYARAAPDPAWRGIGGRIRYLFRGLCWLGGLFCRSRTVDLIHIHSGSMMQHAKFVPKKYVLTLHGTDIRELQYQPKWRKTILAGVRRAEVVMFTTPDLREHVMSHRSDAIYLPMPINPDQLPRRRMDSLSTSRVFFASRWDESKAAEEQVEVAKELIRLGEGGIDIVGLDWGPWAAAAAEAGVRLVPKMDHLEYLRFMGQSGAAIGQSTGILGSSELEAMAMGVPLYMALKPGMYSPAPPVGGADAWQSPRSVAHAVLDEIFDDTARQRRSDEGQKWIRLNHGSQAIVDHLCAIYLGATIRRKRGVKN